MSEKEQSSLKRRTTAARCCGDRFSHSCQAMSASSWASVKSGTGGCISPGSATGTRRRPLLRQLLTEALTMLRLR